MILNQFDLTLIKQIDPILSQNLKYFFLKIYFKHKKQTKKGIIIRKFFKFKFLF